MSLQTPKHRTYKNDNKLQNEMSTIMDDLVRMGYVDDKNVHPQKSVRSK